MKVINIILLCFVVFLTSCGEGEVANSNAVEAPTEVAKTPAKKTPVTRSNSASTDLTAIYMQLLGRKPDKAGADYFRKYMANGKTMDDVRQSIMLSAEYHKKNIKGKSANEYLNKIFTDLLGRKPTSQEVAKYSKMPANNPPAVAKIITAIKK